MILELTFLHDIAILALLIIVAIIFFSSGKNHLSQPGLRSRKIGLSRLATMLLGVVETIVVASVALWNLQTNRSGTFNSCDAWCPLKKIIKWNIGFYRNDGFGWHYDLLLLCANLFFLTAGGQYMLTV